MFEAAANANLVSTISLKRNTPFLQPPTSGPADYAIFRQTECVVVHALDGNGPL
jgi:hypothetical protein